MIKIAIIYSAAFYVVSVGLLALVRSMGLVPALGTAEMFYGPAITATSVWIIVGIVFVLLERKKNDAHPGSKADRA